METEIKHARRDLMRLEAGLHHHVSPGHVSTGPDSRRSGPAGADTGEDVVNVRLNRKLLGGGAAGAGTAGIAAVGRALGWW